MEWRLDLKMVTGRFKNFRNANYWLLRLGHIRELILKEKLQYNVTPLELPKDASRWAYLFTDRLSQIVCGSRRLLSKPPHHDNLEGEPYVL